MTTTRPLLGMLFAGVLISACASGPRARPESAQRVPDSAPEKVASQRAASGLRLEEDDERWGLVAARQRKQNAEQKKTPPPVPTTIAPAPPAGPIDLDRSVR